MDSDTLPVGEIMLQIISSIRTLDGRISEIKNGIKENLYTSEANAIMKERMLKLLETRMMLIYSLMDNKLLFNKFTGQNSGLMYESFKREIRAA